MSVFPRPLISVLLLLGIVSSAQELNFKKYSVREGLPQSQVLCIYQDARANIWCGTNGGGAGKFDGKQFTTFSKRTGLPGDFVFSITENQKGEMLFGTNKGLSVYNGFSFKNYSEKEGLTDPWIYGLLNDGPLVWIATQKGVYQYYQGKIHAFNKSQLLSNSVVWSIYKDQIGDIWFATLGNGVIRLNSRDTSFYQYHEKEGLSNNVVFSIKQLNDTTLLVGTLTGLNKIVTGSHKIEAVDKLPGNRKTTFAALHKKSEYVFYLTSDDAGLWEYDFSSNALKQYDKKNGLSNEFLRCMLKDREGNLWLGGDQGLFRFNNKKFTYYTTLSGLPDNSVSALTVDRSGNYWLALYGKALVRIHDSDLQTFRMNSGPYPSLPENKINCFFPDKSGALYIGTDVGVYLFDKNKFQAVGKELLGNKSIRSIFKDRKNKLWIGTDNGVFSIDSNGAKEEWKINSFNKGLPVFRIFFISETPWHTLMFGLEDGMLEYDGAQVKQYNAANHFIGSRVLSAVNDDREAVWLGTAEGVFVWKGKQFEVLKNNEDLPFENVNFLHIVRGLKLMVGTNKGIDILDLPAYHRGGSEFRHLSVEDGLLEMESHVNAVAADAAGRVLIGTQNGLQLYDPLYDSINTTQSQIRITGVKLFFGQENIHEFSGGIDSLTALPVNLKLPYTKNNLSFSYQAVHHTAPEKIRYKYKLQGLDDKWSPPLKTTEASYPSLPPGSYTFMVLATNSDGIWNAEAASYSFSITTPWFKTVWFYTLFAGVFIGGIFLYIRIRTRKLLADKMHLENVVGIRTKELRAEKQKVEEINEEVTKQKALIEDKSTEITDSIRYAKNIQEALLPSLAATEDALKNCFILYQPKDIVSGDFFWYAETEDTLYAAAADCTGHGVPGAFMSIVGNTLLNEILHKQNMKHPGDILLELHKGVKQALHQKDQPYQRSDGMDIALCAIKKNRKKMEYAGANRPLWIFRAEKQYELEMIKPTKSPIGGLEFDEARSYETKTIQLAEGDLLYIFTDGFADQFGGPKGKKFMVSNLQNLFFVNSEFPVKQQKRNILKAFDDWKGETEQVDDVLVIGIRI